MQSSQACFAGEEINFTYDVFWSTVDVKWSQRWSWYRPQAHRTLRLCAICSPVAILLAVLLLVRSKMEAWGSKSHVTLPAGLLPSGRLSSC